MNLEEYILTCKNFAHDTQDWGGLIDCKFYTTDGVGCWDESFDNAHGGLDIAWAFHCTDEEIEAEARWRYEGQLHDNLLEALEDKAFGLDQWKALGEQFGLPCFDKPHLWREWARGWLEKEASEIPAVPGSYKKSPQIFIGYSYSNALVLRSPQWVEYLLFGLSGGFSAYECVGPDVEIDGGCRLVTTGEGWLRIYDDAGLTYLLYGPRFSVYRVGDVGCIIHWPDGCSK